MADGDDELSAADRRFIRQQRVFMVLNNFCWAIQRPGSDQAYMDLCGGDSALMARHYGGVQSMNNFFNMFLNRESLSIGLSPRCRLTQVVAAYSARGLALRRHRAPQTARAGPHTELAAQACDLLLWRVVAVARQ